MQNWALLCECPLPDQVSGGKIVVSFADEGGAWLLSVSDNGAGMPVSSERGPGLGTGLVEALSKQLDTTLTVLDANPGTRVEIRRAKA